MTTTRGGGALALGLALLGLGAAVWLTRPTAGEPDEAPAPRVVPVAAPVGPASNGARGSVATDPGSAPAAPAASPPEALRPPGDDPALRARLTVHAKVAVADWPLVIARIEDPALRAEAEAMVERLGRLDEDAERLARDEYDLTQRLIAHGGWDRTTLRRVGALNSAAAMVIQGG